MPYLGWWRQAMSEEETASWIEQQARTAEMQAEQAAKMSKSAARRYRIRRGSEALGYEVVEVDPKPTSLGWAFETQDQKFANEISDEIEEACRYFWERPIPEYLGCPEIEGIGDEEIEQRIQRYDEGENLREARRTTLQRFPLVDLPRDRKRSLIERIERIKREYEFSWIEEEATE